MRKIDRKLKHVIFKSNSLLQETVPGIQDAISDPVAELTGKSLPAALNTGLQEVDFEHAQLLACMSSVRQLCSEYMTRDSCAGCEVSKQTHCESALIGLLGDLLAFILDHFQTEEKAMRDTLFYMVDRDVCEAHMEDHAHIAEKIQQIVSALDPLRTVVLIRELDALLERWMSHHVVLHDQALGRWMARQDFTIKPQKI
jgi:hemerythrin-like metal-binding protein